MDKDQLTECKRCGGNACYEQVITSDEIKETVTTWMCMGCGFTSSTQLLKNSSLVNSTLETSPELYKDLMFEDQDGKVWFPSTITLPGQGMVFIDGTSKTDWAWSAVKAVEITEEDRKLKQYPSDQTFRMDMANAKRYGQKEFMDALDDIGFFNIPI